MTTKACAECGQTHKDFPVKGGEDHCIYCKAWLARIAKGVGPRQAIIGGAFYGFTDRRTGSFLGMAGRRFDIEFFDGRKCTTHDLNYAGVVPEHFRDRLPDNARFRQAEKVELCDDDETRKKLVAAGGQTGCWSSTPDNLPEWPKPSQMKYPTPPFLAED